MSFPRFTQFQLMGLKTLSKTAPILLSVYLVIGFSLTTITAGEKSQKNLYERIGGVATIAAMMDDLIDRLYVNPVINSNPAVQEIHLKLHPAVAKFMFTEYFCQTTGGPCTYIGRSMKEAHDGLNITEAEFQKILNKFKIAEWERKELIGIVDYTKADIVVSAKWMRLSPWGRKPRGEVRAKVARRRWDEGRK